MSNEPMDYESAYTSLVAERHRLVEEVERLRLRASELEASMDAAQAAIVSECVELNGHIDIARQCHDWLAHEIMDEGDPTGRLGEFAASLSIVINQFDKQRRRANWHEAGYKAGKQKLIEHAVGKALDAARAAAREFADRVSDLGAIADDNDPRVMATAGPIGEAQAKLWEALGLDVDEAHAAMLVDIESRCAVCGWPMAASFEEGCIPGNCSYRPRPATLYSPARAAREHTTLTEAKGTR